MLTNSNTNFKIKCIKYTIKICFPIFTIYLKIVYMEKYCSHIIQNYYILSKKSNI